MYDIMVKARSSLALRMVGLSGDKGLRTQGDRRESSSQVSAPRVAVELAVEEALKDTENVVRNVEK